jgi:hypothetical protein
MIGYVVLNTIAAVFGPGLLESSLPDVFHPRSGPGIVWKLWITSLILSALLGMLATRSRVSETARWAWLIPAVVFSTRALVYASTRSTGFASTFSGYDCAVGLQKHYCYDFLEFTCRCPRPF